MHEFKIVILSLIFFSSAFANDSLSKLKFRWMSATEFRLNSNITHGEPIRSPVGVSIVLGEILLLDKSFKILKDCVIYRIPSKTLPGELKVIQVTKNQKCKKNIFGENPLFVKSDIYNLVVTFKNDQLMLDFDRKIFKFSSFNLKTEKKNLLLDSSRIRTKIPGVEISFVKNSSDAVTLLDDDICFDVDDRCNIVKDECQYCSKKAIYPVIAGNCKSEVRKYCGIKECGKRGSPACIRGIIASEYTGPYCINDSPIAYCEKPSRVVCVNDELYCR